jgi:hypothetical protein
MRLSKRRCTRVVPMGGVRPANEPILPPAPAVLPESLEPKLLQVDSSTAPPHRP